MDDNICTRSVAFELRADPQGDGLTLEGYAAVFNSPTMISDRLGEYEETIAPGAFKRTIQARTPVLMFEHGQHPLIGSMPIGTITDLREDPKGLYVRARLFDNWMISPVRDAIKDGAVDGMSFRFSVPAGKETWDRSSNPQKRVVREAKVPELGPVVFPAYRDTSVAVRSLQEILREAFNEREGEVINVTINVPPGADGSDVVAALTEWSQRHEPQTADEATTGTSDELADEVRTSEEPASIDDPAPATRQPSTRDERQKVRRQIEAWHAGAR